MISKTLSIVNKLGIHARAASVFVKTASSFGSDIKVINEFGQANGKSIMSMMMIQASYGSTIEIEVSGDDEAVAADAITALVENRFGEAE